MTSTIGLENRSKSRFFADLWSYVTKRRLPLRLLAALAARLRQRRSENREIGILRQSHLFDAAYYCERYPEVAFAGIDPIVHYVRYGGAAGHMPHPRFDTQYYLALYPDVRQSKINPLVHFALSGAAEGRRSRPGPAPHQSERSREPFLAARLALAHDAPMAAFPGLSLEERDRLLALVKSYGLGPSGGEWTEGQDAAVQRVGAAYTSLSARGEPEVSIIVPVHNQLRHTLACLESLAIWPSRHPFEVLVGDDGSTDGTATTLANLPHVRTLRVEAATGFIDNCNRTAALARGRFVVFLNNDTVVLPGGLDALIDTFTDQPEAGLVGARLFYLDGTLQEAGGIIWDDGSGWNFGRGEIAETPAYCYLRQVDYCSAAAIALPTELWQKLGGFDEMFRPAYYEDTDLAFRVRATGRQVLYQPEARVIHFEGVSNGITLESGIKRFQKENHPKFTARWQDTLTSHGMPESRRWNFAERSRIGRILIVDATTPTPDRDSGSLDTWNLMRLLRRQGYHVSFLPADLTEAPDYTARLRRAGIECYHWPWVQDLGEASTRLAAASDAVIVCRQPVAEKVLALIKAAAPTVPVLFNTIDLHFLRLARKAELSGEAGDAEHADKIRRSELCSIAQADATLVVSRYEHALLQDLLPQSRIRCLPIVRAIPEGTFPPFAERHGVLFVGGFRHPPNQDAMLYLLEEIWPRARALGLTAPLYIVGADASSFLVDDPHSGVHVLGHVPDISAVFARARLSVAPIRYGAGLKGKVIDSLIHQLPVVATPEAVEGSGLVPGLHLLTGTTPDELAQAIVALYQSAPVWNRLSEAGYAYCKNAFSLDVFDAGLRSLLHELGAGSR